MPTTRFAPSPTGFLHLGHAYSAGFARAAAGRSGRFLLRLEDIDGTRCKPEFNAGIEEDLAWLGLDWEWPVRRQSEHLGDYRAALDRLDGMGLLYPCFCTRKDLGAVLAASGGVDTALSAPHGPGPVYPGTCRHLSLAERQEKRARGLPYALRLDIGRALAETGPLSWRDLDRGEIPAEPQRLGDVVLARKETPTSYHLAVTCDDAHQDIDLVTRGLDLFEATHIHRLLQALLGLPVPVWRHHRLLLDPAGRRFAKRDKAPTLRALREAGRRPAEVRDLAGWAEFSRAEFSVVP